MKELAKVLSVPTGTLYELRKAGRIPGEKIGKHSHHGVSDRFDLALAAGLSGRHDLALFEMSTIRRSSCTGLHTTASDYAGPSVNMNRAP
ncbi:MAG: helix-turn-helix domain-containing protein [Steroidobacteraceae bacterium]